MFPLGATHAIRRSVGASVATAQAVSPRFHVDFGVVQSEEANVAMLSSALTKLFIKGCIEGSRMKPVTSRPKATLKEIERML
jgi:ferredoxin-fold anticodon binding domain-containing protein